MKIITKADCPLCEEKKKEFSDAVVYEFDESNPDKYEQDTRNDIMTALQMNDGKFPVVCNDDWSICEEHNG